jgi:hypothetical protein
VFDDVTPPGLSFFARIEIEVDAPLDIGIVAGTRRRIVPIRGGSAHGPEFHGTVLDAGADFQFLPTDRAQDLEARYSIEADDGARIYVENRGIRSGAVADLARLNQGLPVNPDLIYFRSSPRLHAPEGRWAWLNSRLFVAKGERLPELVRLEVFVVD